MNIRIHFFNVSCAGFCCVLVSFLAADAREVYPLNGSWDFSFNGGPAGKVTVPHTWNAEDAANGVQGKREDVKSVNSGAYRRGPAVYSHTLPSAPVTRTWAGTPPRGPASTSSPPTPTSSATSRRTAARTSPGP